MRKIKLVNKERFEAFLSVVGIIIVLSVIAIVPRPKSPIEKYHDALEKGMTWQEYVEEVL